MQKDEAKFTKLPKHLLSLIIFLLVLLVLFLTIILWYDHKINHIQVEEQQLRKNLTATSLKNNNLSN
jgi:cell division protein FtsL